VYALKVAPVYVLKCDHVLPHDAVARIQEQWRSLFDGGDVPKLAILDRGLDIQALK
jgi:hypothetical protein